ncbi:MAG: chromosome segregation protein SMC [Dethiobacteria bacterium]|nr:chromosome segregation protein SMC [Bacillota bacterium]
MHLKRMELFGFKSFADRTELELNKGITVVIGPNGCGKSNLVDAARWALGEQSAKTLRGSRMEELIFSGSAERKALNFAEVTLTFGGVGPVLNLDYEELTVTRRIYRSGESEYLINNSSCRLKDITELFLDTGVGREIYSVVGQGRVEEIINSKPEERREIFEEAAGILKYKLRKSEAQRRLEETRENLVRVQDLIFELETQIEPLTVQAGTARRYRELQGRLRDAERKLLSYRLHCAREELAGVERQLQKVTESLSAEAARGAMQEEKLQQLKLQQQEEGRRYGELEQKVNRASREMERQENELRLLKERESRYREQMDQSERRLEELAAVLNRLNDEKESCAQKLKLKREALTREKENYRLLRQKQEQKEKEFFTEEVEKQQQQLYRAVARQKALEASLEELQQQKERLSRRRNMLLQEEASFTGEVNRLRSQREELEVAVREAGGRVSEAAARVTEAERRFKELNRTLAQLQDEEQRCREEIGAVKSRLQLLKDQEADLRGYYRGVREIIKARDSLSGIVGPVVDLLTVEERYLRAIEAALGPALQYIVVETGEAALEAIHFLKENNLGWCTFLPLDTIRAGESILERYPQWQGLSGVYGKASDLVKVEPAYQKVATYLLGSILICHDLKVASEAARLTRYRCRIISLEGDLINPGGAIRGGSMPRRSAGLPLGRRREIEALERELAEMHRKKGDWEEQIVRVRQKIGRDTANLASLRQQQEKEAGALREVEKAMQENGTAVQIIEQRRQDTANALQELAAEEKELLRRRESLAGQVQAVAEEIAHGEAELAGRKKIYRRGLDEKRELEETVTAALLRLNSLQEQEQALQQNLQRISSDLARPLQEQEEKRHEGAALMSALAENRATQEKTAALVQQLREESAALTLELQEQKKKVDGLTGDLVALEEKQRRNRSRLARHERRERHLAVEQSRLQTEINYQLDRFTGLFGDDEPVQPEPGFEAAESERLIKVLREDIEALGVVNLGAIDELARLQERIDFLQEQQDDLRRGEISLHRIIGEIDQQMAHFFGEAFQEIADNLQEIFSELFGGGKVLLKLTDPDSLLESGIEIIAQPPGKKLQNISLLSTGEKTLTAVALIFAILQYKPAPFYLLDEIESSLDDANLSRFNAYLKKASRSAQFILITHRRRTMEEADILYGVTMPEEGVSKIVSLELDQKVS